MSTTWVRVNRYRRGQETATTPGPWHQQRDYLTWCGRAVARITSSERITDQPPDDERVCDLCLRAAALGSPVPAGSGGRSAWLKRNRATRAPGRRPG